MVKKIVLCSTFFAFDKIWKNGMFKLAVEKMLSPSVKSSNSLQHEAIKIITTNFLDPFCINTTLDIMQDTA